MYYQIVLLVSDDDDAMTTILEVVRSAIYCELVRSTTPCSPQPFFHRLSHSSISKLLYFSRRITQSQTPPRMEKLYLHLRHSKTKHQVEVADSETYKAAENFSKSYANAMSLGSKAIELEQVASKLADHYSSQTFSSFQFGYVATTEGRATKTAIQQHLERFEKSGLGIDITMESLRVEVVSQGSALCWITWRIHPKEVSPVKEGWVWQNVYGYRKPRWQEEEKGFWEFCLSDNEIENLVQRIPDFMEI